MNFHPGTNSLIFIIYYHCSFVGYILHFLCLTCKVINILRINNAPEIQQRSNLEVADNGNTQKLIAVKEKSLYLSKKKTIKTCIDIQSVTGSGGSSIVSSSSVWRKASSSERQSGREKYNRVNDTVG